MIVRETKDEFVMVPQHDHAHLSGEVAKHFTQHYFVEESYMADVVMAIYEHDRGWIRLDDVPFWNDRNARPFSFMDYPLLPKMTHYKLGIDELQDVNPYAALLCSMHYSSFMEGHTAEQLEIIHFLGTERERQKQIEDILVMPGREMVQRHFGLLQLCDDISLYVCLNEPGASKPEEHKWYIEGFDHSERLTPAGEGKLVPRWLNDKEIAMAPWPFKESFGCKMRQKRVSKGLVLRLGLQEAYRQTDWTEQEVVFVGE